MIETKTRPCKKCGKKILDAIMIDDIGQQKLLVLDPVPAIYELTERESVDGRPLVHRAPREQFMVSHFNTCPHAEYFGKGKQKAKA